MVTYQKKLMELIERSGGRNRFCSRHSAEYVTHLLHENSIPFKQGLTERDIVSRREEILFQKLWRYIEARIMPIAPEGIDRLVVERTAFDLLAGSIKARLEIANKDTLEEYVPEGTPVRLRGRFGNASRRIWGACAYCGKPSSDVIQRDHILPQSRFFFDSYLNLVPACSSCNQILKQGASPGGAALHIHEIAYQAYSDYLATKFKSKPPHLFYTIKKGVLLIEEGSGPVMGG